VLYKGGVKMKGKCDLCGKETDDLKWAEPKAIAGSIRVCPECKILEVKVEEEMERDPLMRKLRKKGERLKRKEAERARLARKRRERGWSESVARSARIQEGRSDNKIINMIKSHPYLFASIVCSLICGIGAIGFYVAYYSNFHIGLVPIPGRCCFNPGLWVVIPIAFGVGFLIPGIAWVISPH